jgi:hypothetical protein
MTKAEAQRRIRIVGFAGNPGRGLKVSVLMWGTHELVLAGMTVDVFGLAAVPCADRDIGHGMNQVGLARRLLARTAGAAPGTAWAAASDRTLGGGWKAIGAAAPLLRRKS